MWMWIEEFTIITMMTKTDKKLYLSMWSGKPQWSFNFNDVCYFDNPTQAEKFAKKWFKNFKDYKIEDISINVNEVCKK